MRAKALKWGNSLAVRIPRPIAELAAMRENDDIEIEVIDGVIHIRRKVVSVDLESLLEGITPENLHGEESFGEAEGQELW